MTASFDQQSILSRLDRAAAEQQLSPGAVEHIRQWLTEPRYAAYAAEVAAHIEAGRYRELDDVFWTVIPFGTGGRRGRMYPIGTNAINQRTIGESAQGLAEYVRQHAQVLSCGIAYDTRHRSAEFARLCAEIMVANGFTVYFLDAYRSTPELSFLVRYKGCSCGIMVTASHNPPSDNAVKVYWSTGAQLLPPHDQGVIDQVMRVQQIERADFDVSVAQGKIVICTDELDRAYHEQLRRQRFSGPRGLKIIYSPLHGVGAASVLPALDADGFPDVEVFAAHAQPDGDFPNVPDHIANPENTAVFQSIIPRARQVGAEIILATDPDCDRMGCAAPVTADPTGEWRTFSGNQLGTLLADYVLEKRRQSGTLSPEHYLVKTLVTTEMIRRIGDAYGVRTIGNLLVGFKWIAQVIDREGADHFVFGAEESHGYLVGQYARDKDGAAACMLMAELAAQCREQRLSLHEKLEALYWQHGYHAERLLTETMPGSEGMARMQALMRKFRDHPPSHLAGIRVAGIRDYENAVHRLADGSCADLEGPRGDLVIFDLEEEGNYVAARPSGTEPKVKFYLFTYIPPEQLADLQLAREEMDARLDQMAYWIREFAEAIR